MIRFSQMLSPKCLQLGAYKRQAVLQIHTSNFCRHRGISKPLHLELIHRFHQHGGSTGQLISCLHTSNISWHMRIHEPDYLESLRPKEPVYEVLNLQMKGYDFVVLEKFQAFIHSLIESLGLDICDGWALPPQCWRVDKYAPNSAKVEAEYKLKTYQRVLQLSDVPSSKLGILYEMLQECTPPGVTCSVVEHTDEMDIARYVPDLQIKELKQQLEEITSGKPPSKK